MENHKHKAVTFKEDTSSSQYNAYQSYSNDSENCMANTAYNRLLLQRNTFHQSCTNQKRKQNIGSHISQEYPRYLPALMNEMPTMKITEDTNAKKDEVGTRNPSSTRYVANVDDQTAVGAIKDWKALDFNNKNSTFFINGSTAYERLLMRRDLYKQSNAAKTVATDFSVRKSSADQQSAKAGTSKKDLGTFVQQDYLSSLKCDSSSTKDLSGSLTETVHVKELMQSNRMPIFANAETSTKLIVNEVIIRPEIEMGSVNTLIGNNECDAEGRYVNWNSKHTNLSLQAWCCIGDIISFCDKYEFKVLSLSDTQSHMTIVAEVKSFLNNSAPFDMNTRFPGCMHSIENLWVCIDRCPSIEYHLNRILNVFRKPLLKLPVDKQRSARQSFHLGINQLRMDISGRISEIRLYDQRIFEGDFHLEWQSNADK